MLFLTQEKMPSSQMGNFNQIPKLLTQLWELSTLIWEIIGVSLGFHWEIRIYFPCWEINFIPWECFSQYWKTLWEIVGTCLGFFWTSFHYFDLGKSM